MRGLLYVKCNCTDTALTVIFRRLCIVQLCLFYCPVLHSVFIFRFLNMKRERVHPSGAHKRQEKKRKTAESAKSSERLSSWLSSSSSQAQVQSAGIENECNERGKDK